MRWILVAAVCLVAVALPAAAQRAATPPRDTAATRPAAADELREQVSFTQHTIRIGRERPL